MHFGDILERNRAFVRGHTPCPLPEAEPVDLAVVACYDPRLDDLLPKALGLEPGRAFFLRTAGGLVRPDSSSLRSLALAVYMFGVKEIVVVGHTSCRMAQFQTSAFIDAFRKRGVARDAFGTQDLREWAGAIPDPARGVHLSVSGIRAASFIPRDLVVAGAVLDDATGALEVVLQPGEAPAPAPEAAAPPEGAAAESQPAPPAGSTTPAEPAEAEDRRESDPFLSAMTSFVRTLEDEAGLRRELRELGAEMDRQPSPIVKLGLLESFIRKSAARSKSVADAYAELRREVAAASRRWDSQEVVRFFESWVRRR